MIAAGVLTVALAGFPMQGEPAMTGDDAIANGLQFLFDRQQEGGSWHDESLWPTAELGTTARVLLALQDTRAHWAEREDCRSAYRRGVAWLLQQQQAEGLVGEHIGNPTLGPHLLATLVLGGEIRIRQEELRDTAKDGLADAHRRAVDFLLSVREPGGGWSYRNFPQAAPRVDELVTRNHCLAMEALAQAHRLGIPVEQRVFAEADARLREVTHPESGRVAESLHAWPPEHRPIRHEPCWGVQIYFPEDTESPTAEALAARVAVDRALHAPRSRLFQDDWTGKARRLLIGCLPEWDPDSGKVDYRYWCAAARAFTRLTGPHAARFQEALDQALLPHQRAAEPWDKFSGSWDPVCWWSTLGDYGRLDVTALALRALARPSDREAGGAPRCGPRVPRRGESTGGECGNWPSTRIDPNACLGPGILHICRHR